MRSLSLVRVIRGDHDPLANKIQIRKILENQKVWLLLRELIKNFRVQIRAKLKRGKNQPRKQVTRRS